MIIRVYSGDDGESHWEELAVPSTEYGPQAVKLQPDGEMVFHLVPEGRWMDYHIAPRRQFVITLFGEVEIGFGDGSVVILQPGDIMLAEDKTGRGHTAKIINGPRAMVSVPISDDDPI